MVSVRSFGRPTGRLSACLCPSARLPHYLLLVQLPITSLVSLGALLFAACGGEPKLDLSRLPAGTKEPAAASVLRIPRAGGLPQLFRVPALEPSAWKAEDKLPAIERPIGVDQEQGLVYLLDGKRNVLALDLETRRIHTYLEGIRRAALGPDGALYAVDTGSAVTQLVRQTPVRFRSKLQGDPAELHGTMSSTLLARIGGKRPALEVLGSDQPPTSSPLPDGPIAPSYWGDLVAVAADSAVVVYHLQDKSPPHAIRVSGHARAALFSPSGHRIYVARDRDNLLVLDRFTVDELGSIDLPGPTRDLRSDAYGRWILARPLVGDSVWIVDVATGRYVGTVAGEWDSDLPMVAAPTTLLTRGARDVVAHDLGSKGMPETGRVPGGAGDFWLTVAWHPPQEGETVVAADSTLPGSDTTGGATVFLQVSSSQNPAWANELSGKLKAAGLPAAVLAPKRSDEAYRVVLGPYASREQAEATGRKIGMPSFIVTAQGGPDR